MIGKKYALEATYPDGSIKHLWEQEDYTKNMLSELFERYKKPIQLKVIEVKSVLDE